MNEPQYQERVKKRTLQEAQPELSLPESDVPLQNDKAVIEDTGSGIKTLLIALFTTVLAIIGFSLIDAYLYVTDLMASHPLLASLLAALLLAVALAIFALIRNEWKGLRAIGKYSNDLFSIEELKTKGDVATTRRALKHRGKLQTGSAFARGCYHAFEHSLREHHTNDEVLKIYQDMVLSPIERQAKSVLKRESATAGGISLISPNSFIQTLGILWISLRTLRRISLVFGIRPSISGNWRLLRIALENLAAGSLTDLLTDEIAAQLGGTLGDKLLANSVDAVAVASLNQRLGKALIRELSKH
ncbi:DUF697 domain-containing protein [Thiomicrorhabdus heinhorstiae]|uniref:DUF697 domain-containing protein n=1 Tax=Thiomicrorhabdus heinhorstiae TaxID=2748010 RepID=A0ABS0BZN2_9GAMM|nr:DUF697 domain-containing protein [Thiomicrorhabdus heinhorstiae]MBF6058538.1 DUF697 domain-containing protein [Thiomicrorhabdus heinhorstiae]